MASQEVTSGAVVLLSGGLDSAACAKFMMNHVDVVTALHVDYGQAAAVQEYAAAQSVANHYHIELTYVRYDGCRAKAPGLILGRNAFLVLAALMETSSSLIGLGIHSGTRYWDCSPQFIESAQSLLNGCADGRVQLVAPFLAWSKPDIWAYCKREKVPVDLTYSCERGGAVPCGQCLSCLDKEALRAS